MNISSAWSDRDELSKSEIRYHNSQEYLLLEDIDMPGCYLIVVGYKVRTTPHISE